MKQPQEFVNFEFFVSRIRRSNLRRANDSKLYVQRDLEYNMGIRFSPPGKETVFHRHAAKLLARGSTASTTKERFSAGPGS